jgi:hypothetical protein
MFSMHCKTIIHKTIIAYFAFLYHTLKGNLKRDDQQLYQYQQNNHLWPQTAKHKTTTTYDDENQGPGLGPAQKCGGFHA